jgi:predicted alpha/beta hydrolase
MKRRASRNAREDPSRSRSPRVSFEEIEIRTSDGVALRAVVDDPPEGVPLAGTAVLAHAMFGRRTEFGRPGRPGLAATYASLGWRTIAFDFRGHGDSARAPATTGGGHGYDDLVRLDLPAVVDCARARAEGAPVVVVGHSLGAHVALAAQGTGRLDADGVVSLAGNVWIRELEPLRVRWAAKLGVARAMRAVVARVGRFPARSLRLGSDDEPARYMTEFLRPTLEGAWASSDGRDDYLAALASVRVPVVSVASDGDHLECHPACAERFVGRCAGPTRALRVARADDGSRAPGHMGLVTTGRAKTAAIEALAWIQGAIERGAGGRARARA